MSFAEIKPFLKNRLTSVFYHVVSDKPSIMVKNLYRPRSYAVFKKDIEFFLKNFNPVSLPDIINNIENGYPLPEYPFFLSFDDGHSENHINVVNFLSKKSFPATFFIVSSTIDNKKVILPHLKSIILEKMRSVNTSKASKIANRLDLQLADHDALIEELRKRIFSVRNYSTNFSLEFISNILEIDEEDFLKKNTPYFSKSDMASILSRGFTIGAHSHSHFKFSDLSVDRQLVEIKKSVSELRKINGEKKIAFAFPNSGTYLTDKELKLLALKNYISCFFDTGKFRINTNVRINRISFDAPLRSKEIDEKSADCIIKDAFLEYETCSNK